MVRCEWLHCTGPCKGTYPIHRGNNCGHADKSSGENLEITRGLCPACVQRERDTAESLASMYRSDQRSGNPTTAASVFGPYEPARRSGSPATRPVTPSMTGYRRPRTPPPTIAAQPVSARPSSSRRPLPKTAQPSIQQPSNVGGSAGATYVPRGTAVAAPAPAPHFTTNIYTQGQTQINNYPTSIAPNPQMQPPSANQTYGFRPSALTAQPPGMPVQVVSSNPNRPGPTPAILLGGFGRGSAVPIPQNSPLPDPKGKSSVHKYFEPDHARILWMYERIDRSGKSELQLFEIIARELNYSNAEATKRVYDRIISKHIARLRQSAHYQVPPQCDPSVLQPKFRKDLGGGGGGGGFGGASTGMNTVQAG